MTTELVLERVVPLTPQDLWRAWTDEEQLKRWFCPLPWQVVDAQIDLHAGGRFCTVMQGPDGTRITHVGCVLEVAAPHRLVWTTALAPGFGPTVPNNGMPAFTCVLSFEAVEGGTRYTASAMHGDTASAQAHAEMGFHRGWGLALEQLVQAVKGGMKGHLAES